MEFNEKDLESVLGGVYGEIGKQRLEEMMEKKAKENSDELSIEQLEQVKAGYPIHNEDDSIGKTR